MIILMKKNSLPTCKTLVIKIGSATLVDAKNFVVHSDWLDALAEDVAQARKAGQNVVLVSSGAVALGRGIAPTLAKTIEGRVPLEAKQALAAVGQIALMQAYTQAFAAHGLVVAQVLLTLEDSEQRARYLNARHTLGQLLDAGIIPIINENDTVATSEMRVGDNDRLAGRVAAMVSAEALLLLSDVEGLYSADPRTDPTATLIPEVHSITPEIEAMAGSALSAVGTGGMATKVAAAKMAMQAGCHLVIMKGDAPHPLRRLASGERATWFISATTPLSARKQWIGGQLRAMGSLTLDAGAVRALAQGSSLLPVGVVGAQGDFQRGDLVMMCDTSAKEIGRGLSAYSAEELRMIQGKRTQDFAALLGYEGRGACVHRDDMVVQL
jgi:glutamate 5-kinase